MRRFQFLTTRLKEGTVLDIGNLQSDGVLHKRLMALYPKSVFYGLDIVDQKTVGLDFAHQYMASGTKLPFADGIFDTIYAGQVIEHVWNPKAMADECWRVLKPGGRLILDTPNVYSLSRMIRYVITGKDIILGNPEHTFFFSYAMMDNMLRQAGFKTVELATENVCALKSRLYQLPNFWPFKHLGECIMVCATK